MFAPSCHRFLALAVVFVSGCFAELSGDPDPTSEQTCIPGSVACECYGNGTCDPDLECVPEISACVPMNCVAGTEQCVCNAGACADEALECLAGLCIRPGGDSSSSSGESDGDTTSTSGDPSTSSGSPTSSPSTTEDPSTSTTMDPSTSTTSDSESAESDSGDPACHEGTCGECVQCVTIPGNDCEDEAAACAANVGCGDAAQCLALCNLKGLCFEDCCDSASPAAATAAMALNACRADRCATTCNDYIFGQCGG